MSVMALLSFPFRPADISLHLFRLLITMNTRAKMKVLVVVPSSRKSPSTRRPTG